MGLQQTLGIGGNTHAVNEETYTGDGGNLGSRGKLRESRMGRYKTEMCSMGCLARNPAII